MKFLCIQNYEQSSWRASECRSTPQRTGEHQGDQNTKHLSEPAKAHQAVCRKGRHHHGCDEDAERRRMASISSSVHSATTGTSLGSPHQHVHARQVAKILSQRLQSGIPQWYFSSPSQKEPVG
jgi:hypothetical protein